jgi:E3 ubiquitin-protein ligase SHPRH
LVFSEWVDVFVVLEKALAANAVRFLRAGGAAPAKRAGLPRGPGFAAASASAAIAAFQSDADVAALLLPVSRGANGLNLVEARHVLMVEPLLDPGAEAQAIKRVDRIGQVAPTWVHRFVVQRSVEENIHAMVAPRVEAAAAARPEALAAAGAKAALSTNELVSLLRT